MSIHNVITWLENGCNVVDAIAELKLLAAKEQDDAADARMRIEEAYKRGWIECACWAKRDDLLLDFDSPTYISDRNAHLNEVAAMKGGEA